MDIGKVVDYIYKTIGIKVDIGPIENNTLRKINYHYRGLFDFYKLIIQGHEMILLKEKEEQLSPYDIYRNIQILKKKFNNKVVLFRDNMTSYNRPRLIKYKVPFIVPEKHMYIPEMLIDLRESYDPETSDKENLRPATLFVLLFHLLKSNLNGKTTKEIFRTLYENGSKSYEKKRYSLMTVNRAIHELEEFGLCRIEKKGKRIKFTESKKKIFQSALPKMINPVKREKRIFKSPDILKDKYISGISALSVYSNIASGERDNTFAVYYRSHALKNLDELTEIESPEEYFYLQIWKYDPAILSPDGKTVDRISLYLSLRDSTNERIQKGIEEIKRNIF